MVWTFVTLATAAMAAEEWEEEVGDGEAYGEEDMAMFTGDRKASLLTIYCVGTCIDR